MAHAPPTPIACWLFMGGSRALGRAFGCLRRGPTAGAMAMNADAMVANLDLVKISMSFIITENLIRVVIPTVQ